MNQHFAEIGAGGVVLRVIVIGADVENGDEYCSSMFGGLWVKTDPAGAFRGKFAARGDVYDAQSDTFIPVALPDVEPA